MRVAVLGAGGTIAPAIVRDLAESEEVAEMLLLDLDGKRAEAVAAAHGGGKARAAVADAREGLAESLAGCHVLVNAASYRINLEAMRACLAAGCHYLDLGGLYWMTGRQLELHEEFHEAGLLALLGMGSSPGKTNVMAVHALRSLQEEPSELHVYAAGRDPAAPAGGLSLPYALQTLIDELTLSPMVVRDGKPVEIEPLAPGGSFDYPEPVGTAETIHTLHSELRTFPESFGCREASFRLSLSRPLLERLGQLTDASADEIDTAASEALPPSAQTVSVHVVEALGSNRDSRVRVTAVTRPMPEWELGGGVVSTAAPAAAAVRLMARGLITATGALPPERCVDPGDLFPELERRGCTFGTQSIAEIGTA